MRRKRERYVDNKYNPSCANVDDIKCNVKHQIQLITALLDKEYPCNAKYKIYSDRKTKIDYTMYTGTAGNVYVYWREYLYTKSQASLAKVEQAYNTNRALYEQYKSVSSSSDINSFFMGPSGIFALGCVIYNELIPNKNKANQNLQELLAMKDMSSSLNSEDELLYGTAGYLYSLLLVHQHCVNMQNELKDVLISTAKTLIEHGKVYMKKLKCNECLLFPFPKGRQYSLYTGAAHGIIGVVYQILCVYYLYKEPFTNEDITLLRKSVDFIISIQFDSGNIPSSIDGDKDDKIHFCHGPVGAVHLFALSYHLFNDNKYKTALLKCEKPMWERGILLKGNGVCHGIAGTVYGLYKIYTFTKDEIILKKAWLICSATYDEYVQSKCRVYEDPQRRCIGAADTPFSLMEGIGGTLSMYYDMLSGNVCFPGYEIV